MSRFISASLRFMLLTAAVYTVIFALLCRVPFRRLSLAMYSNDYYYEKGGSTWYRYREHDPDAWQDVRVLGSSHAFRGYDPRVFADRGFSLYNLGSAAQVPTQTLQIAMEEIHSKRTGLVMVDIYETMFMQPRLQSTSELTRELRSDHAALTVAWEARDIRALNLLALRFLTMDLPPTAPRPVAQYSGYYERTDSIKGDAYLAQVEVTPWDPKQWEALGRILSLCRERAVPVVLVSHFQNGSADRALHAGFLQRMEAVLALYPDVAYIDLSFHHKADDRFHYYDHFHLNQAGVDLFNTQLIDSLTTLGLLNGE